MTESTTKPAPRPRATAPAEPATLLALRSLSKHYPTDGGSRDVLDDVTFDVRAGEIKTIVGPSGAGKTTLLRCVAGLLAPSSGQVLLDGVPVVDPPEQLAVVFQDYSRSLMPWMSVRANVELPLRGKGLGRAKRRERAEHALADVGLAGKGGLYPWQLSGGMQQRVAIARALAYRPEALLMDEPFASVDAQMRADLEDLVLDLRQRRDITVLLVTHDIDEAVYLGDSVVVLGGTPTTVEEQLQIPLGRERDQVETKAQPEFITLRSTVLARIRRAHR